MSNITPIRDLGNLPEHGRVRTGIKSGRGMKALETFRFTSVDKAALDELAALYGGTVKAWHDDRANPPDQWEVISEASTIEVAVQPGSVDVHYELWTAGGMSRRCDGEEATVWIRQRDDVIRKEQPCICHGQGLLECKLKTRVALIFPSIGFAGTWRYESSGQTVANTVPGMLAIVEALQSTSGLLPIEMSIVTQERVKHGQKRKFSIVQFRSKVSVDQMLAGSGTYQAQVGSGPTTMAPALPPSPPTSMPNSSASPSAPDPTVVLDDDEIVDGELVDDDEVIVLEYDVGTHPSAGLSQARAALHSDAPAPPAPAGSWPRQVKTKADAIKLCRENPGKIMKKTGSGYEVG